MRPASHGADRNTGQKQERTEWHRVVFFNKLADVAGQYLQKGSKVYIEGSLRTRKWQDKDGRDRYTTEIVASELEMLDGRQAEQNIPIAERANDQKPRVEDPFDVDDIRFKCYSI